MLAAARPCQGQARYTDARSPAGAGAGTRRRPMPELLTPEQIARRVAAELRDGDYVNLGFGMPLLVSNHLPRDRDILIHTENGMIGVGPLARPGEEDPDLVNA